MSLRVLVAHNRYRAAGGEDVAFEAEVALLRDLGHVVLTLEEDSRSIREFAGIPLIGTSVSSARAKARVLEAIEAGRPDVAHFHNIHPLFTPSVYDACQERGVPVVQTLHNYRLICPAATLYRSGKVCELCVGRRIPWPGVVYACYRGSRVQSAAVAAMLGHHNTVGTWKNKVGGYISLTQFMRRKLIDGGLPGHKIHVKPNFVPVDPGSKDTEGEFALFVGRLSPEKGVDTLLESWRRIGGSIPLEIVGEGPLADLVAGAARESSNIRFRGRQTHETVLRLMKGARFLVFPSGWYEGFPMVIAEAFACGLPVLAAGLGSAAEIVRDGETGRHFSPGSAADLADRAEWAWRHPRESREMGKQARRDYERLYTPESNYRTLLGIYQSVRDEPEGGR
jgi:glycosyltransferase involved in cell wall biosynthesis